MRRFRDIIESPFPVPTTSLWLKGSTLKGFVNGKWTTLGGGVKIASSVADTDATEAATAQTVAITLNELLAALRASRVLTA